MNTLHIYGQTEWHGDAFVFGDKTSLEMLRDAIDEAIAKGPTGTDPTRIETMVNDGEGFYTFVVCCRKDQMEKMAVPYMNEIAKERRECNVAWPEEVCGRHFTIIEEGYAPMDDAELMEHCPDCVDESDLETKKLEAAQIVKETNEK